MKRRILKKQVNYIVGELFAECVVLSKVVPGIDGQKVDELMARVLYMHQRRFPLLAFIKLLKRKK